MEKAIFAAGCFWGVETAFSELPGVTRTEVGYIGGKTESPTYEAVCRENTGHAEAVLVEFDPSLISYKVLAEKFFELHDPTQLNRQGPDVGDQYRSAVFFTSPEQEKQATEIKTHLGQSGRFKKPIATVIAPAAKFWPAEDYHQQYFAKRGGGACHYKG